MIMSNNMNMSSNILDFPALRNQEEDSTQEKKWFHFEFLINSQTMNQQINEILNQKIVTISVLDPMDDNESTECIREQINALLMKINITIIAIAVYNIEYSLEIW